MTVTLQVSPFLPRQRNFPNDNAKSLSVELDKTYVDIAQRVNERSIGLYSLNYPTITGDSWYLVGQPRKQQTLRQIYTFTAAGNIAHGINWASVAKISPNSYGSYTDGTNWYGAIYASNVAIAGQVSFYVTPTNIVVLSGAGAPAITSGVIVLEWLTVLQNSNP